MKHFWDTVPWSDKVRGTKKKKKVGGEDGRRKGPVLLCKPVVWRSRLDACLCSEMMILHDENVFHYQGWSEAAFRPSVLCHAWQYSNRGIQQWQQNIIFLIALVSVSCMHLEDYRPVRVMSFKEIRSGYICFTYAPLFCPFLHKIWVSKDLKSTRALP